MQTLSVAREAGVKGMVYLSVFKGADYVDVPHFAGKHTVERMIEHLRYAGHRAAPRVFHPERRAPEGPVADAWRVRHADRRQGYFDGRHPRYRRGRRSRTAAPRAVRAPLPRETYELVGPDAIDAETVASIWAEALGRPVRYGGDDLDVLEQRLKAAAPAWLAYDMRLMMGRYQQDGAVASKAEVERLAALLGRQPRSYRDFAAEMAAEWATDNLSERVTAIAKHRHSSDRSPY